MFSKLLNFVKSLFRTKMSVSEFIDPETLNFCDDSTVRSHRLFYATDQSEIDKLADGIKPLNDHDKKVIEINHTRGKELVGKTFELVGSSEFTSNPYKSVFNVIDQEEKLKEAFRLISKYDTSAVEIHDSVLPHIDYSNYGPYPCEIKVANNKNLKDKINDRIVASLAGPYKAEGANLEVQGLVKVSVGNVSSKEIPNTIENVKLCLTKKNSKVDTSTVKITVKKKKVKKKK